ncbi:MAG: hypothetical protein WD810_06570 [Solirubrobacterales bacterium]
MTETADRSKWSAYDYFAYAANGRLPTPEEIPPGMDSSVLDTTKEETNTMTDISPGELRRHPISATLQAAAAGHSPTERELDALALTPAARRRVADAAKAAAATHSDGEFQAARRGAEEAAHGIVSALPSDQRDADYLRPPEPDITDPAALAEQVSGW